MATVITSIGSKSAVGDPVNGQMTMISNTGSGTPWTGTLVVGSAPTANVGDMLYFIANDGSNGIELWKTNGTEDGTMMVSDVYDGGSSSPNYLTVVGDLLYFKATDGTHGYELWRSDGTVEGTILVKDIAYGGDSGLEYSTMQAVGEILLFTADDGYTGLELYWNSFPETNIFYEQRELNRPSNSVNYE